MHGCRNFHSSYCSGESSEKDQWVSQGNTNGRREGCVRREGSFLRVWDAFKRFASPPLATLLSFHPSFGSSSSGYSSFRISDSTPYPGGEGDHTYKDSTRMTTVSFSFSFFSLPSLSLSGLNVVIQHVGFGPYMGGGENSPHPGFGLHPPAKFTRELCMGLWAQAQLIIKFYWVFPFVIVLCEGLFLGLKPGWLDLSILLGSKDPNLMMNSWVSRPSGFKSSALNVKHLLQHKALNAAIKALPPPNKAAALMGSPKYNKMLSICSNMPLISERKFHPEFPLDIPQWLQISYVWLNKIPSLQ